MKKLIILGLIICGFMAVQAQTSKTAASASTYKGTGAEIKFEKLSVDFG